MDATDDPDGPIKLHESLRRLRRAQDLRTLMDELARTRHGPWAPMGGAEGPDRPAEATAQPPSEGKGSLMM
jgi:hypothetical protein